MSCDVIAMQYVDHVPFMVVSEDVTHKNTSCPRTLFVFWLLLSPLELLPVTQMTLLRADLSESLSLQCIGDRIEGLYNAIFAYHED